MRNFTDNSKINYKEAVDVMSAVKVIDGYAEGDFRPSATPDPWRCRQDHLQPDHGPHHHVRPWWLTPLPRDVPTNHTFAGYIAYCQEKIISVTPTAPSVPPLPLTGYAFMKMLLGALGYDDAEVEQYTGAN